MIATRDDDKFPCLVVTSEEALGTVHRLDQRHVCLGSDKQADIYLPMRGVGAFHAELSENDQQWLLSSCDDHLTLHKDKLVQAPISLSDGDGIELGNVKLKFRIFDQEDLRYHAALRQLAIRDGLTDLYNVRFFADALQKEHEYSFRKQSSLALLFMDIDHFKLVNDRFGHAYGDFVLKELASLLTTKIRGYDLLARYGGEEFVFMVREEAQQAVHELAHRICSDVREHVFNHIGIRSQLTASIGYFWWDGKDRETSAEDILKKADDHLYAAKDAGRDRVIPANLES